MPKAFAQATLLAGVAATERWRKFRDLSKAYRNLITENSHGAKARVAS